MALAGLTNPPDAGTLATTDELLSQLAGSEIDRLLAEAESSTLPDSPSINEPNSEPLSPTNTPAVTEAAADAGLNAELDALFDELQESPKHATPQSAKAPTPTSVAPPASAPAESLAPAIEKPDALPEGDERAALLKAAGFDASAVAAPPSPQTNIPAVISRETEREAILEAAGFDTPGTLEIAGADDDSTSPDPARLPFYLKLLEWINAPLAKCPQTVRQALGQAAIVTMFTSTLVLAYVWMIRKH
ncbi:MAG: hypothetical protein M3O30_09625 [Planctomycetota bacterium]|nr:hypothetical protein [Planctomycetota bacterium]